MFELTNEQREKAGLPALVWAKSRTEDAQIRARELATLYSHTKPDGTAAIWENVSMAGETVAVHYENSQRILTRLAGDPKSAVQGWMNSDGHKANILHTGAVAMAVGCYVAENGNIYWVQCFTSNQNDMINPIMTNPLLEK